MAISECDEHVEVRIKRPPADSLCTYFEEFVDPKLSGAPAGKVCESYIIAGEHDAQYLIEVILKPGFKRYGANTVRVDVWLGTLPSRNYHMTLPPMGKGGLQEEKTLQIQRWTSIENGAEVRKNIAFSRLETAPELENQTTVLGLDPTTLGSMRIEIQRSTSSLKKMSRTKRHSHSLPQKRSQVQKTGSSPKDTPRPLLVDEKLGKPENGGITHSTKLLDEGSKRRSTRSGHTWSKDATPPQDRVGVVKFVFKFRTHGVLDALGIVKKPPPLWEWAWCDLNILDRPKAFKQLQKDNKMYEMKEWEMKIRTGVENQEPPEWKAYSKIHDRDKKRLFDILQEKNKAYTRRDGRRDVKIQVKQLEYEQGPDGWEKHGDTHAISAKKQEQPTDVGKGSGESRLSGPTKSPEQDRAQTVNDAAHADAFSAAPSKIVIEQKPSNVDQDADEQNHETFGESSQAVKNEPIVKAEGVDAISMDEISPEEPTINAEAEVDIVRKQANASQDIIVQNTGKLRQPSEPIKHESNVKNEPVVKSEPSTASSIGDNLDQERPSKRRKISNTSTQPAVPSHSSKLFSATIDITGDVPIVEPKAAITIDLTAEPSSSIKHEKLDDVSTSNPARQPQSKTEPSLGRSTSVKPKSPHPPIKRRTILDLIEAELMNPSDTMADAAEPSKISSKERVRPTPTQAAQRGECSIQ